MLEELLAAGGIVEATLIALLLLLLGAYLRHVQRGVVGAVALVFLLALILVAWRNRFPATWAIGSTILISAAAGVVVGLLWWRFVVPAVRQVLVEGQAAGRTGAADTSPGIAIEVPPTTGGAPPAPLGQPSDSEPTVGRSLAARPPTGGPVTAGGVRRFEVSWWSKAVEDGQLVARVRWPGEMAVHQVSIFVVDVRKLVDGGYRQVLELHGVGPAGMGPYTINLRRQVYFGDPIWPPPAPDLRLPVLNLQRQGDMWLLEIRPGLSRPVAEGEWQLTLEVQVAGAPPETHALCFRAPELVTIPTCSQTS